MSNPKRKRVLLIAEAANPEWVSVPLVGWSLVTALSGVVDVHVVTQIRNRDAFLRAGMVEGQDFTAIDSERVARPLWRLGSILRMGKGKGWTMVTAMQSLAYFYFERLVWKAFKDSISAGEFDLVHRVTPLGLTAVSKIAKKCHSAGVPFVLGPLNGGIPWPRGFDAERRREREWLSYVRSIYKIMPGHRQMLDNASAIIAASCHTRSEVPQRNQHKTVYIPENAIDAGRFNRIAEQDGTGPLRACFVGRLVPYKGPDILLEAATELLRDGRMTLDIVGDGPLGASLRDHVSAQGLDHAVTLHGNVEHHRVQDILAGAHLMAFPSIREFGGGVVLEAMALGVVPLVVNYGGPGELVTDDTGFRVPIGTRADIVVAFRQHLESLASDRSTLPTLAERSRERVAEKYTWPRKAEQINAVYDWVLGGSVGPAPVFFEAG